jgi:hypothetical protein
VNRRLFRNIIFSFGTVPALSTSDSTVKGCSASQGDDPSKQLDEPGVNPVGRRGQAFQVFLCASGGATPNNSMCSAV